MGLSRIWFILLPGRRHSLSLMAMIRALALAYAVLSGIMLAQSIHATVCIAKDLCFLPSLNKNSSDSLPIRNLDVSDMSDQTKMIPESVNLQLLAADAARKAISQRAVEEQVCVTTFDRDQLTPAEKEFCCLRRLQGSGVCRIV